MAKAKAAAKKSSAKTDTKTKTKAVKTNKEAEKPSKKESVAKKPAKVSKAAAKKEQSKELSAGKETKQIAAAKETKQIAAAKQTEALADSAGTEMKGEKKAPAAKAKQKVKYEIDLREMLEAGCHFGHQARRWNPKMTEYIYTERDKVHIFDLAISAAKLVEAMEFVRDWVADGKEIVFVGTKRQAADIVREEAVAVGAPHVTVRWLGGTLTNWNQMKKRIKRLKDLKSQKEAGEWAKKYTKKEQVLLDREISRLERFFGGIAHLTSKPEALFVVDTHRETTAIKEAQVLGIPVVGLVDTNGDPDDVEKIIPVNDDAVRSIKLTVNKIAEAYADGKAMRGKVKPKQDVEAKKKTTNK